MLTRCLFKKVFQLHARTQAPDHYSVLGVTRAATATEIKLKYYELAKIYHPDINKDSDAQLKFTHISKVQNALQRHMKFFLTSRREARTILKTIFMANSQRQNLITGSKAGWRVKSSIGDIIQNLIHLIPMMSSSKRIAHFLNQEEEKILTWILVSAFSNQCTGQKSRSNSHRNKRAKVAANRKCLYAWVVGVKRQYTTG